MADRGRGSRLLFETPQSVAIGSQCCGQNFDRYVAVKPRIAGTIDLAHPADTE